MDTDYIRPLVTDYGTVQAITAGQKDGNFTDANFDVNTPKDEITFSAILTP